MGYPDNLPPQSKDKYCPEHEMYKVQSARGGFTCPFCESNVSEV